MNPIATVMLMLCFGVAGIHAQPGRMSGKSLTFEI